MSQINLVAVAKENLVVLDRRVLKAFVQVLRYNPLTADMHLMLLFSVVEDPERNNTKEIVEQQLPVLTDALIDRMRNDVALRQYLELRPHESIKSNDIYFRRIVDSDDQYIC